MDTNDTVNFDRDCCKPFLHVGNDQGVLLLHGFTGSVSHMRPLGDALADRGYTVMGINLPGHATTEADMARTNAAQWLQAARDALLTLEKRCVSLTVAGLSMGGVIALILAQEGIVDACVPISAPMGTQNPLIRFAAVVAPFHPRVSWEAPQERHQQLDADFDYGYSGFPTRSAAELYKLIRKARAYMQNVVCPLLAVQSTGDQTVWPGSADFILTEAKSIDKQKLLLQDVPHVCTISTALPTIVDTMDTWMQENAHR